MNDKSAGNTEDIHTMRHRVALAICRNSPFDCCWNRTGENSEVSAHCATCQSIVSAVLSAMKKPTQEMIKAGAIYWDAMDGSPIRMSFDPTNAWLAMIDAAMKETS